MATMKRIGVIGAFVVVMILCAPGMATAHNIKLWPSSESLFQEASGSITLTYLGPYYDGGPHYEIYFSLRISGLAPFTEYSFEGISFSTDENGNASLYDFLCFADKKGKIFGRFFVFDSSGAVVLASK